MPMVGQATERGRLGGDLLHHAFEHEQEAAGLVDRPGVGQDLAAPRPRSRPRAP